MTEIVIKCTPRQLERAMQNQLDRLERRVQRAIQKTAEGAVEFIKDSAPVAFGDLAGSVTMDAGSGNDVLYQVMVKAPHAYAVEMGSAPHRPDFQKLLAWVRLRGFQALQGKAYFRRKNREPTTLNQASRVGDELKGYTRRAGKRSGGSGGRFSPADAPMKIALRIFALIEQRGTKPHAFVRTNIENIERDLAIRCQVAIEPT